jgi:hypothetical protein
MKGTITVLCLALTTALGAHAIAQSGQDLSDSRHRALLKRKVMLPPPGKITIHSAFRQALSSTSVPGGIILTTNCDEEGEYEFSPSSASLRDTLDAITAADPAYKWSLESGVVNLVPKVDETPLLSVRITKFELNNTNLDFAADKLFQLPEVKERQAELNLSEIRHEVGISELKKPSSSTGDDSNGFKVSCEEVTLRQALNAIVRAYGHAVWSYSERHCNGKDDARLAFIAR